MKDEFPITRRFCLSIRNISSVIFSIIVHDTNGCSGFYKESFLKSLNKCEQDIDDLDNNLNYVAWSRENWTPMIRELIDSVDSRSQLQEAYDIWIEMVSKTRVYGEDDFSLLMKGRKEGNTIDELGIRLLRRILRMMEELFVLVQELKLEYDLYDKDDYNLSPAFLPFFETIEYFNGPIEPEEQIYPRKVVDFFKTDKTEGLSEEERIKAAQSNCSEFFSVNEILTPPQWVKRAVCFHQGKKLDLTRHGVIIALYRQISKKGDIQYDNFQKQLNEAIKLRNIK